MKTILFTLKESIIKNELSGGGGCFFVKNLYKYLLDNKYNIVFDLKDNIDLIIIIDPRRNSTNKYSINDIINYKNSYPNVKILHRINECDCKREKSINIEPQILKTMQQANYIVFVSEWLKNYYFNKYNLNYNNCSSIINGCDQNIFSIKHNYNFNNLVNNKIKLVTHHFSDNYLKGFHIYNQLDYENNLFEFTYIGNYNKNYNPKYINIIEPCNGLQLANIIKQHDIYITATQNEPGAMHYLEGISCGLPILYCINGGGTQEVCEKFGEEYSDLNTLIEKINLIKNNYSKYVEKIILNKNNLSKDICNLKYLQLINNNENLNII